MLIALHCDRNDKLSIPINTGTNRTGFAICFDVDILAMIWKPVVHTNPRKVLFFNEIQSLALSLMTRFVSLKSSIIGVMTFSNSSSSIKHAATLIRAF